MNWLFCALMSALFAGLVAIFGKIGVKDVDSTIATTARAIVMAVALIVFTGVRGQFSNIATIPLKTWTYILLAGAAGAASWLFYFQALKIGDAARVAPIDRLSMIVTLLLAWLFLGEKMSVGIIAGTLLVLGGAILIARG